ncbi:MAG: hypothetical protein N2110_03025 [Flavobacteriales bacterium]|nr:hypothetical protein [Flavobacteriales bacterium]
MREGFEGRPRAGTVLAAVFEAAAKGMPKRKRSPEEPVPCMPEK